MTDDCIRKVVQQEMEQCTHVETLMRVFCIGNIIEDATGKCDKEADTDDFHRRRALLGWLVIQLPI